MSSVGGEADYLTAQGMQSIDEAKIAEFMGVNIHVETPHESIPGVTVGRLGGPLYELVKLVRKTLNETGDVLVNSGYRDLGGFVLEALKEGEKATTPSAPNTGVEVFLDRVCSFNLFRITHNQHDSL